ncbi:hypothetical protein ACLQ3K_24500 [Tsukamurella sp. DT100]|uniref:hypothetical protein n=1 Tax=Tsukamurella sp. DT100 TaxID=3393415 RepID=UPI003CF51258
MNDAADPEGAGSVLDDLVGPFYDVEAVVRYLALREGELAERIATNEIIWAPLANGTPVFPTWQFDEDDRVPSGLLRVWQTLRRGADPWTAALWMSSPAPDLGGVTVAGYLAADASPARLEYVTMLADLDTERWFY